MELVMLHGARVLTPLERQKLKEAYLVYRCACMRLANHAVSKKLIRWRQRPKSHQLEHLVFDWKVNPRKVANYLDEDYIRRAKRMALASSPRYVAKHVLFRFSIDATLRWTELGLC